MKFAGQLSNILTWQDLYLTPLYLLLLFLIIRKWRKRYADSPLKKYVYAAFWCRMFGCIFLALILNFYYGYGDTFSYYTGAHEIWSAFKNDPKIAWEIIFSDPKNYSSEALEYALHSGYPGFATSHYAMFKVAGIIGLFGFGTYLPIALIFSLLSFFGTWMIFLVFSERYPALTKYIAISTMFIPSLIIWTTGIMKEPICMLGLGLCFYTLHNFLKGSRLILNLIIFLASAVLLIWVKDYIFYLFIIAAAVWCYKTYFNYLSSPLARLLVKGSIYAVLIIMFMYFFISDKNIIQESFTAYFTKAQNLQLVMTTINNDFNSGSGYTLPTNDLSGSGLVTAFLLSVNVSLFRPYVWECTNPLMILNFLESFATMLLVITLLFKTGFIRIYKNLKDPVLLFSLLFSLMMAALVGFVSFNFGTLIRYKTPFEPFFYSMLFILLYNKTFIEKKEKYPKLRD